MPHRPALTHPPDHLRLAPPREDRWSAPVGLALLVHGLLLLALTWGVNWTRETDTPVFEAELWSSLPVQAAPRAAAPPAPPPLAPAPARPENRPPPPRPAVAAPPPGPSAADIATQRANQQAERSQRAEQAAREKARAEKAAAEKKAAEQKAAERAAEQAAAQKKAAEIKAAETKAAEKRAAEKKAAEQRLAQQKAAEQRAAERQREQERAEAAASERQRQDNIRRMLGQAGASGGPQASGTAARSSGPSPSYGGLVAARIKPNVVFTDAVAGNPRAEVEVRTQPDGTIVSRRLVKSSGHAAWDEAVLKAIDRTATLPRDTDGRVPALLIIGLRPQD